MTCIDCGQEFLFTSGEQAFYAQRGFTEAPKRCTGCRTARKAQRNAASSGAGGSYGGGYDRDAGYGGGYGGAGDSFAERRPKQLYAAVCAECGKTAQVPFQPTGARPVYCSDCFQSRR
jgi:CxxC-x17-CxxC domain-containing protein